MTDDVSIESLREAIRNRDLHRKSDDEDRLHALARGYEESIRALVTDIVVVVKQVGDLTVSVEDEAEDFTSPAFPGRCVPIRSQKVRITLREDFLLFDPAAEALASALGQVKISASRTIPFLIERTLYLIRPRSPAERPFWAFRSIEDPLRFAIPFDKAALVRMLHAVFA